MASNGWRCGSCKWTHPSWHNNCSWCAKSQSHDGKGARSGGKGADKVGPRKVVAGKDATKEEVLLPKWSEIAACSIAEAAKLVVAPVAPEGATGAVAPLGLGQGAVVPVLDGAVTTHILSGLLPALRANRMR